MSQYYADKASSSQLSNVNDINIIDIRHPNYLENLSYWQFYRDTLIGGRNFVNNYLVKFSTREDDSDFSSRQDMTYCPAHAKAALLEIKNAIYQRMVDIKREGGSDLYQAAVAGENYGVDLAGRSMTAFIGDSILQELLALGKVGVYIDREALPENPTLLDTKRNTPYLYYYQAEDILSWSYDSKNELAAVLLRDYINQASNKYNLPDETITEYRYLYINEEGTVTVEIYTSEGYFRTAYNLQLTKIPFIICELSHSLLVDIADYQKALLQLASSDMNYAMKSNFPFYVEQYDPQVMLSYMRRALDNDDTSKDGSVDSNIAGDDTIKIGPSQGRRYPKSVEAPSFINPSPEPLRVSMEKQEILKAEIRQLIHLNLAALSPQRASADAKREDERGLEAGLSYIGLALEYLEREIAKIWALYERTEPAKVFYPRNYSLRSEAERLQEAKQLSELMPVIPSLTFQKQIAKQIVNLLVATRVSVEDLNEMENEIDKAKIVVTNPETIWGDLEKGLVSEETASIARGYPKGEVEQARIDHANRAARIALAQSKVNQQGIANAGARGIDDLDVSPADTAKSEKNLSQNADTNPEGPTKKTKGN